MTETLATGGVAGAIADIERRRLETQAAAGMTMACSAALHRLHELLEHETEALRLRGPGSGHLANIVVISTEIGRVKNLSALARRRKARGTAVQAHDR